MVSVPEWPMMSEFRGMVRVIVRPGLLLKGGLGHIQSHCGGLWAGFLGYSFIEGETS